MTIKNPERGVVVITIKHGESFVCGESFVTLIQTGSQTRLAINAPKSQRITRHKALESQQILEALKTHNISDLIIDKPKG